MLISTLRLEGKALKAFRAEPETETEDEDGFDLAGNAPSRGVREEIELGSYQSRSTDGNRGEVDSGRASGLQYMGGEKERGGKKRSKKE